MDDGGVKGEYMSYQKILLNESLLRSYHIQGRDLRLEFKQVVKSILSENRGKYCLAF